MIVNQYEEAQNVYDNSDSIKIGSKFHLIFIIQSIPYIMSSCLLSYIVSTDNDYLAIHWCKNREGAEG